MLRRRVSWRLLAAIAVFALLFIGGVQPFFAKLLVRDNAALAAQMHRAPDAQAPGYAAFMQEVRERTENGAGIAIVVPMRHWEGGYSYAYYRASYLLAGRRVVPVVNPADELLRENLGKADYIAAWRVDATVPGFEPVWRSDDGTLLRRRR